MHYYQKVSKKLIPAVLLLTCICLFATASAASRKPVALEGKESLYLRVLTKPFSNIYQEKDATGALVMENTPAFQPYFVYTKPTAEDKELGDAWYEIGSDANGTVVGWMMQKDLFEWKQTLCLAYTHPEGRHPVLMFDGRSEAVRLVEMEPEQRIAALKELEARIDSGNISRDFPVKSVEPKRAVDISREFYLLPILDYEAIELDNREGRLVELAAVTNAVSGAREASDIRENKAFLEETNLDASAISSDQLKDIATDVVWVIDTTVSMRPYIEKTLEIVQHVSKQLQAGTAIQDTVRFGIWGYRDSAEDIKEIGYTTHNYTRELQSIDAFTEILKNVQVTEQDSVDYAEDMFSGMADTIKQTAWTEKAIRCIILVGDAPSHEIGHKWNLSGMEELGLRELANDRKLTVFSLHLKNPRAKKFHETAEMQYRTLALNPGAQDAAYWDIDSTDLNAFAARSDEVSSAISGAITTLKQLAEAGPAPAAASSNGLQSGGQPEDQQETDLKQEQPTGELAELEPEQPAVPEQSGNTGPVEQAATIDLDQIILESAKGNTLAAQAVKAAVVQWIGSRTRAKAPRDITAWAVDKDLETPSIQAMEVKLLITKAQLSSLYETLKQVLMAGMRGQLSSESFFDSLQATAAATARDPEKIGQAKDMADTGLVPEFLEGLPYTSRLMDMNNELWSSWSVDEQDSFLNSIEANIETYKVIHDSPEGWVQLNPGDDPDAYVYPLSLDMLP